MGGVIFTRVLFIPESPILFQHLVVFSLFFFFDFSLRNQVEKPHAIKQEKVWNPFQDREQDGTGVWIYVMEATNENNRKTFSARYSTLYDIFIPRG